MRRQETKRGPRFRGPRLILPLLLPRAGRLAYFFFLAGFAAFFLAGFAAFAAFFVAFFID